MESWDFNRGWSFPEPVLMPDFEDGLNIDLYSPGYMRYPDAENAHFMFPSVIDRWEGTLKVKAAVSRDGRSWLRPNRSDVLPLGEPGTFDGARMFLSPDFVPLDRDTYAIYYRATNDCLASITFPGPRQLHFPINDNYSNGFGLAGKGEARARSVRFCLRERDSGGGKVENLLLVFHFSTAFRVSLRRL